MNCIFCNNHNKIIAENELAYAIFQTPPISRGHMLFIPKKHANNFSDIAADEITAILDLIDHAKVFLDKKFNPIKYQVGINCRLESTLEPCEHAHFYLLPHYEDSEELNAESYDNHRHIQEEEITEDSIDQNLFKW